MCFYTSGIGACVEHIRKLRHAGQSYIITVPSELIQSLGWAGEDIFVSFELESDAKSLRLFAVKYGALETMEAREPAPVTTVQANPVQGQASVSTVLPPPVPPVPPGGREPDASTMTPPPCADQSRSQAQSQAPEPECVARGGRDLYPAEAPAGPYQAQAQKPAPPPLLEATAADVPSEAREPDGCPPRDHQQRAVAPGAAAAAAAPATNAPPDAPPEARERRERDARTPPP